MTYCISRKKNSPLGRAIFSNFSAQKLLKDRNATKERKMFSNILRSLGYLMLSKKTLDPNAEYRYTVSQSYRMLK